MPANKFALLRYRVIDRCLTNKGKRFPSREDLRQACEEALYGSGGDAISVSTIDKDIWAMKNESELGYHAPIAFNRYEGGYYYEDENFSISQFSLGEDDLQAIRFATATLDQFRHVPIFKQYESAIEKIINRVNISPNPDDVSLEKYIQFEKSTVSKGNDLLGPLLNSIQNKKSVRIQYRKFTDDELKAYDLHPYLLKEYHNRWYLIAKDAGTGKVRTFGLERVEYFEQEHARFVMDKSFDPDVFFKYSIGITEMKSKPQEVRLRFASVSGKFLMTQPIHPSQRVVREDQNGIEFSFKILLTQELISFILSYGNNVEVLKPEGLRNEVKSMLEMSLKNYV